MFKWLAVGAAVAVALPLALLLLVAAAPTASQAGTSLAGGPSVAALSGIPPTYLALYMGAARTCPGPNRAPGRYDTPLSKGTPTMLTSADGTWSMRGRRANVAGSV